MDITIHSSDASHQSVHFSVFGPASENLVMGTGTSDQPFAFKVDSPSVWTPGTPTLYNISITMGQDTVTTYTGFRSLAKGLVNGVMRPLLNDEFIFAFGTLE